MAAPMDEDYVDESERDSPPPRRRRSVGSDSDPKAKEAQNARRMRRASQWRTSKNFEQHMATLDKLWRGHQKIPTLRGLMRVARIGYPKAQELLKAFRERHNLSEEDLRRHQGRGRGTKGSWVVNDANYNAAMQFDTGMNMMGRGINPTMNPAMSNMGSMNGYGQVPTVAGPMGGMGMMNAQPPFPAMGPMSTPRSADDDIKERINAAVESVQPYINGAEKGRAARLLQQMALSFTQVTFASAKCKQQVAGLHRFIASLFLDTGDCENAYQHIEAGLQLFHQIGEKYHNEYTWDLYKMGAMILKGNKQSEDARRMFKFALGVAERLWSKNNKRYLEMLEEVSVLSVALFEWDRAKEAITELSQLYQTTQGVGALHTLNAMAYQACIHYACQEDDAGASLREQVLALAERYFNHTVAQWQYQLYFAAHAQMLENKEIDCSRFLDFCLNWKGEAGETVDREKKEGLRLLVGKHVLQLEGRGEMDRALHYLDALLSLDESMGGQSSMYMQTLLHRAQLYKHIGRKNEAYNDFQVVCSATNISPDLRRDAENQMQSLAGEMQMGQSSFPVFGPNGSPVMDVGSLPYGGINGNPSSPLAQPHQIPNPNSPPPLPSTVPHPAHPTHPTPLPNAAPQQSQPQSPMFPPTNMALDLGSIPSTLLGVAPLPEGQSDDVTMS